MTQRRHLWPVGATLAVLALAACTLPVAPPPPGPETMVEQRLIELAETTDALSGVKLGPDSLIAYASTGGDLRSWNLIDGVEQISEHAPRGPMVPFGDINLAVLQGSAAELAGQCETTNHAVSIDLVTRTATITSLYCGEDSYLPSPGQLPDLILLDGEPLVGQSGTSIEETWHWALKLLTVLDPELRFTSVSIDADSLRVRLSDTSADNGCTTDVTIARNGSAMNPVCWTPLDQPDFSLAGFTATDLADLQLRAMADADAGTSKLEVTIDALWGAGPELRVRQYSNTATVPLR